MTIENRIETTEQKESKDLSSVPWATVSGGSLIFYNVVTAAIKLILNLLPTRAQVVTSGLWTVSRVFVTICRRSINLMALCRSCNGVKRPPMMNEPVVVVG